MEKICGSGKYKDLGWLTLLVAVVVLVMVASIALYRYQFGGLLAVHSSEWSNFGSYIGGVLGPMVSLVTLFAVLKTVYMQREMLNTQKSEFTAMVELQRVAALKQDEQLVQAKSEANRARVQAYQATVLNTLDKFGAEFRYDANELLAAAEKATSEGRSILDGIYVEASYRQRADDARKKVTAFTLLALELSTHEFQSVEEIQSKFVPQMLKIMYPEEYGD
jgi:hypothetical protein